jgi:hypothetical protein
MYWKCEKKNSLAEGWKQVGAVCLTFPAYSMGLGRLSYGTQSTGLESRIVRTVMAVIAVSVSIT